jgi:hypothetical protein
VTHVESTGNVGWWVDNDEFALILDLAVRGELGLTEAGLVPPVIPRRLDSDGIVGFEMGVVERSNALLLSNRSLLDIWGKNFLGLLLLDLLLLDGLRGGLCFLCLLCLEFGGLLGLFALLLHYTQLSGDCRKPDVMCNR